MALDIDRTMRLPESEFLPGPEAKAGIALHHTVGGSARSTFNWWRQDRRRRGGRLKVGTAYIIDRDGTVFEVFPPEGWAYQFGLRWPVSKKLKFEKRYIGIEIASEGGLTEHEGDLYRFDRISTRTRKSRDEAFDHGAEFRGYRYFDQYEPAQIDAVVELVDDLCTKFDIRRRVPDDYLAFYGERLSSFDGVIGHSMLRQDKSDPAPDQGFWNRVVSDCGLKPMTIGQRTAARGRMTENEIEALLRHNTVQTNTMHVSAGSVIQALLTELDRSGRNTYVRLTDPAAGGRRVEYEFVQGDRRLVKRVSRLFGIRTTDTTLEVAGG